MKTFKQFINIIFENESKSHTVKVFGQGLGIHHNRRQLFYDNHGNKFHGTPSESLLHFQKLHPTKSIHFTSESKKRK